MIKKWLSALVKLCRRFGKDPLRVQAAGGNVSVKTGRDELVIKASGSRLNQMTPSSGWAVADQTLISRSLPKIAAVSSPSRRERSYAGLLGHASKTPGRRVSMETGFHAVLPETYVVHLHSLVGMLLGMMP